MTNQLTLASVMLVVLLFPAVHAQPVSHVQTEVDALLDFVGKSGCEFYRNGIWHDSKEAQSHLNDKYAYLTARNLIKTTEDFIDKVATKSALSGQVYEVKCNKSPPITSKKWLNDELSHIR